MYFRNLIKLTITLSLILIFSACEDKDEQLKASLSKPEWNQKAKETMNDYFNNWHDADHDPASATKIGFAYSQELKDYEKAIEWYKYSNSMKPSGANSNYTCYAYQQLKQFDEAISWCKHAVELGEEKALIGLGSAYDSLKNYDEAIAIYKKAYDKKLPEASNNLGTSYSFKGDFKEAEKWYLTAVKEENFEAYENIAKLYHFDLKDDIKASAYALILISNKYNAHSVVNILVNVWKIPVKTIKQGYDLQLSSPDFPIKFEGRLSIFENEKSK